MHIFLAPKCFAHFFGIYKPVCENIYDLEKDRVYNELSGQQMFITILYLLKKDKIIMDKMIT